MKKKILGLIVLAISSFGLMASTNAVKILGTGSGAEGKIDYEGSNVTLQVIDADAKVYKLVLIGDADEDLVIEAGQTVTIDLAGNKWTNYDPQSSAISIPSGAKLTIMDSGNGGTFTYKANAEAVVGTSKAYAPLISNAGTLIFESGTIDVNKGATDANATGILNSASGALYVEGGLIKTSEDYAWGITNEGNATINGGTFLQGKNYSIIDNAKNLTINDGKFTVAADVSHFSLITNKDNVNPTLQITNGDFSDSHITKLFHKSVGANKDIVLTGGKYPVALSEEVKNYIDEENYEITETGEVVTDANYEEYNAVLKEALSKVEETSKYTEESIKALQSVINNAKRLSMELKSNEQSQIDDVVSKLKAAINGLKLIEKEVVDEEKEEDKDKEDTSKDDTPPKNPNTFDGFICYIILAIEALGITGITLREALK